MTDPLLSMYSEFKLQLLNHSYFKRKKEEVISARPITDFNRTQGSTRNNSTILKEERSPRSSKMINPSKTQHLFDDMLNILGREGKPQAKEEARRVQPRLPRASLQAPWFPRRI
jgi:hypothetical protein